MRAMFLGFMSLAMSALLVPACGEEPVNQPQISEPTLGVDENAACLDANWYCQAIGGISAKCAIGSCGQVSCATHYPHTETCQNSGTSWVTNINLGLYPAGDYPCTITAAGSGQRATPSIFICRADFDDAWVYVPNNDCGKFCYQRVYTYNHVYQNHYVNNPGTCVGFVECLMSTDDHLYQDQCACLGDPDCNIDPSGC